MPHMQAAALQNEFMSNSKESTLISYAACISVDLICMLTNLKPLSDSHNK
jgi:hypothetical protein